SMYSSWHAAGAEHGPIAELDGYWRADRDAELVYFHGFDNTYHWGLMDLTLLMAHGDRYVLPAANICNEFYELEGAKFSTSRNHLMRGGELLAELPRDLIRFYLAMTAPEQRRTNFTPAGLHELTRRRLVEPWNALADRVDRMLELADSASLPTTATGRGRAKEMLQRLAQCYELPNFSMTRAAQTIAGELVRLSSSAASTVPGDLLLAAHALLAGAAPILIDLAEQAADGNPLGFAGRTPCRPSHCPGCSPRPANSPNRRSPVTPNRAPSDRRNAMKLLAIEPQQYMHYYQGRYQRSESYGHTVYVLNGIGTEDFWPTERYRLVGSKHIDDIIAAAKRWHAEEQFDGVITYAEFAVTAVAAVAEALGLPGIDVHAAIQSRNKYLMRQAYQRAGAPIPSYRYVAELTDALAAAEEFGYPVILKPTLGAGSYYVFKVHSPSVGLRITG